MGLLCLMGHDFGEVLTDRDREERGDDVLVTIREYRECQRCGETRIISENKEVRRVAPPEPAPDYGPEDEATPAAPAVGTDDPVDGSGDPTVATDDAVAEAAGQPAESLEDVSADEDDGIILADEPEPRDPTAWPEPEADQERAEEGSGEDGPTPWPTVEGDDEGFDAEPSDGRPLEGVEFGSSLTPEAAASDAGSSTSADAGGEIIESAGPRESTGFRQATPGPSPTGRQRMDAASTEFYCPECAFVTQTEDSSLRPGDICPNCRLGYLTERER